MSPRGRLTALGGIFAVLRSGSYTVIVADLHNARRVLTRCQSQRWWHVTWNRDDLWYVALSDQVDLDEDLRRRIPGVQFEVFTEERD